MPRSESPKKSDISKPRAYNFYIPELTATHYVVRDSNPLNREPIISDTKTPVRAIVELWRLGVRPEEIPERVPHLTLAQVFDTLGFYEDNQTEINGYIKRNHVPDQLVHPLIQAALEDF